MTTPVKKMTVTMANGKVFDPSRPVAEQTGDLSVDTKSDRVRFSRLKKFAMSPMHYFEDARTESAVLDKGSAVHSMLLKGQRVCYYDGKVKPKKGEPPSDKIGPRNGEQWEQFKLDHPDELILTLVEYNATNRMVDAVRKNKFAMDLIAPDPRRKIEDTIEFDYLGISSRTTPDARTMTTVVELKTCRSARPIDFMWQSKKMLYHAQMANHRNGMRARNPNLNPEAFTIAVENSGVPAVVVYRTPEPVMLEGEKIIRSWYEQLKVCLSSGHYPGYSEVPIDLELPGSDIVEID